MAEAKIQKRNTYTIYDDEGIGTVQIADEVVAIIAGLAATEVDGVASMAGNITNELVSKLGMKNLSNIDGINLSDVKMTSELCEQFNVQYKSYDYDKKLIGEFPAVEKNEEETALVLQSSREFVSSDSSMLFGSFGDMFLWNFNRISYIRVAIDCGSERRHLPP